MSKNGKDNPSKRTYPVHTGGQVSAFGDLKVSTAGQVWKHKNTTGKGDSIMDEWLEGFIIVMTGVTGTFEVDEIVTGGSTGFDGVVTAQTATSVTINTLFHDFGIGETLTGGTSGATGTISTIDTGANIVFNINESTVSLIVPDAISKVIRQPTRPLSYIPKAGQFIAMTGVFADCDEIRLVRKDSTSGSIKTRTIEQVNWSEDRFDGSKGERNRSEFNLDCAKRFIFWMDMEWLAAGKIRGGFDFSGVPIVAHEENHANIAVQYDDATSDNGNRPYFKTASLYPRYEIENDGTNVFMRMGYFGHGAIANDGFYLEGVKTAEATTMKEFCHSIDSDGGYELAGLEFTRGNGGTKRTGLSVKTPIFAIRCKTLLNGITNRRVVKLVKAKYFATGTDTYFTLEHFHHPNAITANWIDNGDQSAVEYSTDITAVTGRPCHVIDDDSVSAAGGSKGGGGGTAEVEDNLHGYIANDILGTTSQMFVIYADPTLGGGTAQATGSITWKEFD